MTVRWLAMVLVLAGCPDGSGKHTNDSQLADAPGDSAMQADGPTDSAQAGSGEVIATGSSPFAITVTDTTLYWSDQNLKTVSSMPVAGGTVTTLATDLTQPFYLQHDAASLYWGLDADVIAKIPLAGGTPVPLQNANNTRLTALAIDATYVVHTEDYTVPQDCSIVAVPKAGGTRVILASGGMNTTDWNHPTGMVLSGGTVFWGGASPGAILTVPVTGGTTSRLVTGVAPYAMAADATNVYWLDGNGTVMKVAQTGGTPVALATNTAGHMIIVDGSNVYWSTIAPSAIYKVAITGGPTVTLASGLPPVNGIAVDATNLYWTETTGAIKKTPK